MRILVVEDSRTTRQLIEMALGETYEVDSAEDGEKAMRLAMSSTYDLVISDINMENMGGFELVRQLRGTSQYRSKPILFLTTESSSDMKSKGRSVGANGWIVKPFSTEKLISMVERCL